MQPIALSREGKSLEGGSVFECSSPPLNKAKFSTEHRNRSIGEMGNPRKKVKRKSKNAKKGNTTSYAKLVAPRPTKSGYLGAVEEPDGESITSFGGDKTTNQKK